MLQPGTQIGRYEIQRRLGRGGMGTVYVAHDPVLGRMVAVKLFLSDLDLPDAADRFSREARSAAALNHANIVTVHDFGDWQSQPYIVMEYVQGETLAEIIRRKAPVTAADKLRWIEELCAGVAYAHQVGVIHRDIKPTNLMVDRSGRLKVLDFGIAKMLGTRASSTALIGTPGYMAPEQILGGSIDHRSDLFSVGVVCYELLTYTEAFHGENVPAITHRILNDEPASVAQLVPDASPDLVAVVERALKKSPLDRFADAESFRQAIARVRRQLEIDPGWDAAGPTRVSGPPGGGTTQRGTGSARKQLNDVIGVAELTPPPDPRKTDREALARRRAAQIEASLELARLFLQQNDLDQALDSCEQALTLDDTHAAALEIEKQIKTAMARKRAGALVADARGEVAKGALTAAQTLLQQARTLDPETPEAKRVERDLRLARVEQERLRQRAAAAQQALASARSALARGDVEGALGFARETLDLDPESKDAREIEADAMRRLDDDDAGPGGLVTAPGLPEVEKTMLAPARGTPAPVPTPAAKAPGTKRRLPVAAPKPASAPKPDPFAGLRAFAASVPGAIAAAPKRQKQIVGAAVAGVLLVIAIVAGVMMMPARVVPRGTLVIDAVPWATITRIQAEDGTNHPLPNPASTPLSLNLPTGTYQINIAGPGPAGESRVLTVQVQEGAVASATVERFETLTPESYFEPYLASPAPSESPVPTDPGAPADPAAVPPPATPPPGTVP